MFYLYVDPDVCPICGETTDPEDIVDHYQLGPCCYSCACKADFPPDVDLDLSEDNS